MILSWLRRRRETARKQREAQRAVDAMILWPRLWVVAEGRVFHFLMLAAGYTCSAPAWRYSEEWVGSHSDAGIWAARQCAKEMSCGTV